MVDAADSQLALLARFWSKVDSSNPDGCWLWLGHKTKRGYGLFSYQGRETTAHRVALILSGVELGGLEAAHRCDNPPCVRPSHLFPATHLENQQDMARKGRAASGDRSGMRHPNRHTHPGASQPGEKNAQAKLTEDQVRFIRASSEPGIDLARRYGVQQSQISRIRKGQRWGHVA
jgi:hypothetical protein